MRAIIAAGGTAGHINPALAIAREIMRNEPDSSILFVGRPGEMEEDLVKKQGFDFSPIEIHSIGRGITPDYIKWNIMALRCLARARKICRRMISEFKPDVAIGTGSFVSYPVIREAARAKIPCVIHEQNSYPGLANRVLARHADRIYLSLEEASRVLHHKNKSVVVGNPVNPDILSCDRNAERAKRGIGDKKCIVSFGGSQGAFVLNEVILGLMEWERQNGGFYHIHGSGARDFELMNQMLAERGVDLKKEKWLNLREYISDMPQLLACADLVICRSGATTVFEVAAAGRASILVPCPDVTENHQYHNALALKNAGAAMLLEQKDLTSESLIEAVRGLFEQSGRLEEMGINARSASYPNSDKLVYRSIRNLIDGVE